MTDIFDRTATRAIDKLIDLLGIHPKSRTVAYQMLAVALRGAWYAEHQIAVDDDLKVFTDQVVELRIRHKDAVPPQWRVLDIPIIEDTSIPVTHMLVVYHDKHEEKVAL